MSELPNLDRVDDPIAEDNWSYVANGNGRVSRIIIGRPRPWPDDPNGDWGCPVEIEHFTEGAMAIAGVGPVDALMNAVGVVNGFADRIGKFAPRAQRR